MLIAQHIGYTHPDKSILFSDLNFSLASGSKVALIGHNGSGKSTVLRLISNELALTTGQITTESSPFSVPQLLGQYNHLTVAAIFGVEKQLRAYYAILDGDATEENLLLLDDDWTLEERCLNALTHWDLGHLGLFSLLENCSGGEKTKIFLAAMSFQKPSFILLDEPSNHLDSSSRAKLAQFIKSTACTLLLVSHDRQLLDLMDETWVLSATGMAIFGGNYSFYAEQQSLADAALEQSIQHGEKALRKAKEKERATLVRQQKQDARGKKKQEKAGVARIMMNTMRNSAEKSTSKTQAVHHDKVNGMSRTLKELRMARPDSSKMRFGFANSALHRGKILVDAQAINIQFDAHDLWPAPLSLQIKSGDRIVLKGENGSGKTTFIQLLLGNLHAYTGSIARQLIHALYIDQDYSLLESNLTVYEQAQSTNDANIEEHQVKTRLDQFLFAQESWSKKVDVLSGGEKMRLALCCLTLKNTTAELLILDEPTNNLDIQSLEILTRAVAEFPGTLLVVSHDQTFIEEIGMESEFSLSKNDR